MDLDLLPAEARELIPDFIQYYFTTSGSPPIALVADYWNAEAWAQFLDWLHDGLHERLVGPTFAALRSHLDQTYESMKGFREFYVDDGEYTLEHLALIANVENLVDFILFHDWEDERIKPKVIELVKELPPTPTEWMKGFDHTTFSERSADGTAQLIAAHWEATTASFQEWTQAVYLLNRANKSYTHANPAVDPEIVLLRTIAIDKMRAIVRADPTFKSKDPDIDV